MSERNYLYRAKDAEGRAVTDQVWASSAENAVQKLRHAGFKDIELFTDDICSRAGEDPKRAAAVRRNVSPDILIRLQSATPRQVRWLNLVNAYRKSAVILALFALVFAARRFDHSAFGWFEYTFFAMLAMPIILVLVLPTSGRAFREMQRATVEARYEDMLKLSAKLEPASRKRGAPGVLSLAVWRAQALVGLGRMEEALAVMETARATPGLSQGTYQVRLAAVYAIAQDVQKVRQCCEEAIRLEPNLPGAWLGLADVLACRLGETTQARAALEHLSGFALTAESQRVIPFIEGAIALNERRFDDAREKLGAAHADAVQWVRTVPLAIAVQRLAEALLTMACAGAGDQPAAEEYFAACEDFHRLHGDEALLRRCELALRITPHSADSEPLRETGAPS